MLASYQCSGSPKKDIHEDVINYDTCYNCISNMILLRALLRTHDAAHYIDTIIASTLFYSFSFEFFFQINNQSSIKLCILSSFLKHTLKILFELLVKKSYLFISFLSCKTRQVYAY